MQALEFKIFFVVAAACTFEYGCDRVRVVGGELAVKRLGPRQHFCRTGEIRHIGIRLAGKYRVTAEALHLRTLDFGIPVRTFHQPCHHSATMLRR